MSSGDEPDDDVSEEVQAAASAFFGMAARHPTFHLIHRVATRYTRLKRLQKMDAPSAVIERDEALLDEGLEQLCQALPYDTDNHVFSLPGLIQHFNAELERGHGTGDDG